MQIRQFNKKCQCNECITLLFFDMSMKTHKMTAMIEWVRGVDADYRKQL